MNQQTLAKKPRLLIFDLDGTLLDSVLDLAVAVNVALQKNGLATCTDDEIRAFVGNGAYTLCQRAAKIDDPALIEQIHRDFSAYYEAHTCVHSLPYQGVNDGLNVLKQAGFRLALCTNKPKRFIPVIIERFGWQFELALGGDSLAHKKPDPEPLLHICHTLKIPASGSAMIGDSKNDIIAGKAANMTTLALSYGYNYHEPISAALPDKIFDEFGALVRFLCA